MPGPLGARHRLGPKSEKQQQTSWTTKPGTTAIRPWKMPRSPQSQKTRIWATPAMAQRQSPTAKTAMAHPKPLVALSQVAQLGGKPMESNKKRLPPRRLATPLPGEICPLQKKKLLLRHRQPRIRNLMTNYETVQTQQDWIKTLSMVPRTQGVGDLKWTGKTQVDLWDASTKGAVNAQAIACRRRQTWPSKSHGSASADPARTRRRPPQQ